MIKNMVGSVCITIGLAGLACAAGASDYILINNLNVPGASGERGLGCWQQQR